MDWFQRLPEATTGGVLQKIFVLKISLEDTCARVSFLINKANACDFIKKETFTQVFSREFCEIFKRTYSQEHGNTYARLLLDCWLKKYGKLIFFTVKNSKMHQMRSKYTIKSQRYHPLKAWRKLNVHETFKRRSGHLLIKFCTFSSCLLSGGDCYSGFILNSEKM